MMSRSTIFKKTEGFDVWLLIGKTNLKVHRALNQTLSEIGLSLAQHEILMAIQRKPGLTQKEVAMDLLVVKSNISAHITKLEKRGLIVRETNEKDSRNKNLSLTAAGKDLVCQSFERQNALIRSMVSEVSQTELDFLHRIMSRVGGVLDELLDQHTDR